jgi:delta 1-pyrroline-5-carboxylate dehydrogenase
MSDTPIEQIPEILERARQAQREWARTSFRERRRHVERMREYICANAEAIAATVSQCNGKTRIDALATEVIPCTLACSWYGKNAAKTLAPRWRHAQSLLFAGKRSQILRVPIGVVAIVSPWNYPLSIPFGEVVMGLMAGNAVLLKVATATPLVGGLIDAIVGAGGLPAGLFHLEMTEAKVINWGLLDWQRDLWWYPHDEDTHAALLAALRLANARSPLRWLLSALQLLPFWWKKTRSAWRLPPNPVDAAPTALPRGQESD